MSLTVTAVLAVIAPELSADARIDTMTEIAAQRLSASTWGAVYVQAVAYLVAHLLTLAPLDGDGAATSGPETNRSAGDVSIGYGTILPANLSVSDAVLMQTRYGREFLNLRNSRAARAPRVIRL